jgi:hypothetical protein
MHLRLELWIISKTKLVNEVIHMETFKIIMDIAKEDKR